MTANEIHDMMRKGMGQVPAAIEKSVPVDPELIQEHIRSKGFAMPAESPALDEEIRTLIYLAAALAGTSTACVQAMATKISGDAEPVFDALANVAAT